MLLFFLVLFFSNLYFPSTQNALPSDDLNTTFVDQLRPRGPSSVSTGSDSSTKSGGVSPHEEDVSLPEDESEESEDAQHSILFSKKFHDLTTSGCSCNFNNMADAFITDLRSSSEMTSENSDAHKDLAEAFVYKYFSGFQYSTGTPYPLFFRDFLYNLEHHLAYRSNQENEDFAAPLEIVKSILEGILQIYIIISAFDPLDGQQDKRLDILAQYAKVMLRVKEFEKNPAIDHFYNEMGMDAKIMAFFSAVTPQVTILLEKIQVNYGSIFNKSEQEKAIYELIIDQISSRCSLDGATYSSEVLNADITQEILREQIYNEESKLPIKKHSEMPLEPLALSRLKPKSNTRRSPSKILSQPNAERLMKEAREVIGYDEQIKEFLSRITSLILR